MLIKTRGIVLRAFKYSETSVITEIYTEACGLCKYIVSGVRSKKAKVKPSLLQHMSIVDLVAYNHPNKELNRIKEIKPAYVYQSLPFEIRKSAVGLFMTEIAQKTLRESEENENLFAFLYHTYTFLDQSPHPIANLHLHFMVQLTQFLGIMPSGSYTEDTPYFDLREGIFFEFEALTLGLDETEAALLGAFLEQEFETSHIIPISANLRANFLKKIIQYYRLHLENFSDIQAHTILKEVFS